MNRRVWTGLALAVGGALGLGIGWLVVTKAGTASAVLAVLAVLALAAGSLLAATAGGPVAVRTTGGVLFVAGLSVLVTQHHVWWWLPNDWATPVSVAATVVSVVGLGVLVLAYGFGRAGLSGALGLLALTCLVLSFLDFTAGEDEAVLRAFATALGAVALTTGLAVTGRRWAITAAGIVGAAATAYAGYYNYETYAPGGHRAAVIGATVAGILGSLGSGVRWPAMSGRWFRTGSRVPPAEPAPPAPPPATAPATTAAPPPVVADAASATAAPPASHLRGRLETASLVVGLAIGVLTIVKELVSAALALFG